jgi:hypothetical protein
MRSLSLVLLLLFALSVAQAVPLQGGNDAVKCTIFNLVKMPVSQDKNNTQAALELDVGLLGASNATYELVDSKDNVYRPGLYKNLQPGRQLLVFAVPEGALFKLLKVTPTEGKPFSINWWKTPKGIKGDIILRYYGIVDWAVRPDQQAIAYNVSVTNNGSTPIYLSPENFTLLDQWGWPYYTITGFTATPIAPKRVARVNLVFGGISPFSIPSALAYDFGTDNQIIIDLDKDMGQLTDEQINGATTSSSASTPTPSTASASTPSVLTPSAPPASQSTAITPVQPVQTFVQPTQPSLSMPSMPSFNGGQSMENSMASLQQSMMESIQRYQQSPRSAVSAETAGASVTSTQTSAPSNSSSSGTSSAQSASNRTAEKVLSLTDQINASKARLAGLNSNQSGGQISIGQKINASVAEAMKRLEKVTQSLQNNTKNQTKSNNTTTKTT